MFKTRKGFTFGSVIEKFHDNIVTPPLIAQKILKNHKLKEHQKAP